MIDENTREKVLELNKKGISKSKIAKELDISRASIYTILNKNSTKNGRGNEKTNTNMDRVVENNIQKEAQNGQTDDKFEQKNDIKLNILKMLEKGHKPEYIILKLRCSLEDITETYNDWIELKSLSVDINFVKRVADSIEEEVQKLNSDYRIHWYDIKDRAHALRADRIGNNFFLYYEMYDEKEEQWKIVNRLIYGYGRKLPSFIKKLIALYIKLEKEAQTIKPLQR